MVRVHIICEGQTEETFIKEVLQPIFSHNEIYLLPALIGRPGHKGGAVNYQRMLRDIRNRLGDSNAYCTTFFDFYGLDQDFPGKQQALNQTCLENKKSILEQRFKEKIINDLGQEITRKFFPYVQMYEFESLLFSSPKAVADNLNVNLSSVESILQQFETPEHINNSSQTAPSKRLISLNRTYDKVLMGSLIALDIGIDDIRQKCKGFDEWLKKIETL